MKYTALSLFVLGVANAGSVTSYTSGSGAGALNQNVALANGQGAAFGVQQTGQARFMAAGQGAAAGGASSQGWN